MTAIDLQKLHLVVSELNQETDLLNEAIRDFEDRLAEIGPGCETWVPFGGHELGYAKVDGKWCVAVRRVPTDEPAPLLSSPRKVRIAACDHLAELASQILMLVESRLIDVRRARKIVKGLGE